MLLPSLLAQVGTATAADCALTGICGLVTTSPPVPSGVFFVALGMVGIGLAGWRRYAPPTRR